MKFTPTVTKELGTALDIILSIFGFPIECKKVSTGIALIQQALSIDSSPDNELEKLSEQIAKAINTIATNEVSEEDKEAVLREAKDSLENFKENAEKDGKDIKNIFADNMNSPDNLIEQICAEHKSLGGEAESCYQNIIRMTVTALCKAENVELFINQNYALVKLMQNDIDVQNLLKDNSSKIDDIIAMLVKLIKERCLTQSELPYRSTTNIFSYLNKNIKFQGREAEQEKIRKEQEKKGLKPEVWLPHYALVTCIKKEPQKFAIYDAAGDLGFNKFYIKELLGEINNNPAETESDIFNEFWFRWLSD